MLGVRSREAPPGAALRDVPLQGGPTQSPQARRRRGALHGLPDPLRTPRPRLVRSLRTLPRGQRPPALRRTDRAAGRRGALAQEQGETGGGDRGRAVRNLQAQTARRVQGLPALQDPQGRVPARVVASAADGRAFDGVRGRRRAVTTRCTCPGRPRAAGSVGLVVRYTCPGCRAEWTWAPGRTVRIVRPGPGQRHETKPRREPQDAVLPWG